MRGLCLATGRLAEARDILTAWAGTVSQGMLPNRFPDQGDEPEYNSVDASLWYIIVVHEFLEALTARPGAHRGKGNSPRRRRGDSHRLHSREPATAFAADTDGLLACGCSGCN
jgi:hypothetical protein